MSYGSMPGLGDSETWPMAIGNNDPRFEDDDEPMSEEQEEALAELAALRNEAEGFLAESIANERMASIAWVSDAQCDFSTAEYDEITAAIINADLADKAGSAEAMTALVKLGRLMLEATRRSIKRDADKAAQECADRLEREDEFDECAEVVA